MSSQRSRNILVADIYFLCVYALFQTIVFKRLLFLFLSVPNSCQCLLAALKFSICAQLLETTDAKTWSDTDGSAYYYSKSNRYLERNRSSKDLHCKKKYIFSMDKISHFSGWMFTRKKCTKNCAGESRFMRITYLEVTFINYFPGDHEISK